MMKLSQPATQTAASSGVARDLRAAFIKTAFLLLVPVMAIPRAAFGQALPTAEAAPISNGFALPRAEGSLQYGVTASESLSSGYFGNSGIGAGTSLSGDTAYLSNSKVYPFSMVFSGGRSWSSGNQPSYGFLNLAMSQVVNTGRWTFVFSDGVSYLPGTPSTGLSGVPGVGDLGLGPVEIGANTGQGVLTNYSTRVNNFTSGSVQRQLTGKTSLQGSGSYFLMRFLGGSSSDGLDSSGESGSLGLSHRVDARSTVGGNYGYSRFTYGAALPGFFSQTASLQYSHQLTHKLGMSVSAGPQWTSIINSPGNAPGLSLFADISANYAGEFSHASASYTRSTNAGSGVVGGSLADSISFMSGRTFDRVWNCSFTVSYTRTGTLPVAGIAPLTFHTEVAGVQVARALRRSLSAYASYTLENQSSQGSSAAAVDVFNGLSNVASFGLTYSPSPIHLGHQ